MYLDDSLTEDTSMNRQGRMRSTDTPNRLSGGNDGLRAPLKWALAGTMLVTVAVELWPRLLVVGAQNRTEETHLAATNEVRRREPANLSERLPILRPEQPDTPETTSTAAAFDPFIGVVAPPAPAPVAPPAVVASPPPPSPPAQDYRFLGRITGPDGATQLLLSRGDSVVPISVGTVLENGYKVMAVSEEMVLLAYEPLGTKASIVIGMNRPGN